MSPSARGARIETPGFAWLVNGNLGRPPRGGRGSKRPSRSRFWRQGESPSARGARIKTSLSRCGRKSKRVALREGGADRNISPDGHHEQITGRPPRGGRG